MIKPPVFLPIVKIAGLKSFYPKRFGKSRPNFEKVCFLLNYYDIITRYLYQKIKGDKNGLY